MRVYMPALTLLLPILVLASAGQPSAAHAQAFIDGTEPGFRDLSAADFAKVNSADDTWSWKDGVLHCTSGIFVWATPESIKRLTDLGKGGLPDGIEVQILDHGYTKQYEERFKKPSDWFTTNGDVFPVRVAKMKPFPPVAPDGKRSFPSKNLSKGVNEWNHYYIRAINGEVRLWVNGEEVSGGTEITPSTGYLCLESEGAPVEFRKLRLRELP